MSGQPNNVPLRQRVQHGQMGAARLLVIPDSTLPVVHFALAFAYGALLEGQEEAGALGTLLELMLRGTKARSRTEFHDALEQLGSSLSVRVSHEMAVVHGACLAPHLPDTMALMGEALLQPALGESALQALIDESCEQLRAERDDDDAVAELFLRRAFWQGTPLARAAGGEAHTLRRLTPAAVRRLHGALSQPGLVAAFAGDVTEARAKQVLQPLAQALPKQAPSAPPLPVRPTATTERAVRIVLVDKPERTQVQLRLALAGMANDDPRLEAFWLGIVAFGGTFTSPLTREVRDKRGWSYTAQADVRRRSLHPSPVVLRTAPAIGDAIDCLALQLDLLQGLRQGALQTTDVQRARDYVLGRAPFWTATATDVLSPALALTLLNLPLDDLWGLSERVAALDLQTVPRAVAEHLQRCVPVAVMVGGAAQLLAPLQRRFGEQAIEVVHYTDAI